MALPDLTCDVIPNAIDLPFLFQFLILQIMSFVTYVLAAGFLSGIQGTKPFSPEMLGRTASFAIVLWLLEVRAGHFGPSPE